MEGFVAEEASLMTCCILSFIVCYCYPHESVPQREVGGVIERSLVEQCDCRKSVFPSVVGVNRQEPSRKDADADAVDKSDDDRHDKEPSRIPFQ